jgi:hypothetical protein
MSAHLDGSFDYVFTWNFKFENEKITCEYWESFLHSSGSVFES